MTGASDAPARPWRWAFALMALAVPCMVIGSACGAAVLPLGTIADAASEGDRSFDGGDLTDGPAPDHAAELPDTGPCPSFVPSAGFEPVNPDGGFAPLAAAECLDCVKANCCVELGTCIGAGASPSCNNFAWCLHSCLRGFPADASSCRDQCAVQSGEAGVSAFDSYESCMIVSCPVCGS